MSILRNSVWIFLAVSALVVLQFLLSAQANAQTPPYILLTVTNEQGETGSSVDIVAGETATLDWYGEEVKDCVITPGDIAAPDSDPDPDIYAGSMEVTPEDEDTTYEITCGAVRDSASVTPPITTTIEVSPDEVVMEDDGSFTPSTPVITWDSEHADSCEIERRIGYSGSYETYMFGLSVSGSVTDTDLIPGRVRYRVTCTRESDGASDTSSRVVLIVKDPDYAPQVTLTADPEFIVADSTGRGDTELTVSTNDVHSCDRYIWLYAPGGMIYYAARTDRTGDDATYSIRNLNEPGTWLFEWTCTDLSKSQDVVGTTEVVVSYDHMSGDEMEPELEFTADPSIVDLDGTTHGRTTLSWETGPFVMWCNRYIERRAPGESEFTFETSGPGVLNTRGSYTGSVDDRTLTTPGTYTYRHTCYSSHDYSRVVAETYVEVIGFALDSQIDISADPESMTPDESTGIVHDPDSVTVNWDVSYQYRRCGRLTLRDPDGNFIDSYSVNTNSSAGTRSISVSTFYEFGTHELSLVCEHPTTREDVVATTDFTVNEVIFLPSSVDLQSAVSGDTVTLQHTVANVASCDLLKRGPSDGSFNELSWFSMDSNTTDTLTENGTYTYRLECFRNFDDTAPYIAETDFLYDPQDVVTGEASIQVGYCRNADGVGIPVPDGYDRDGSGNCILTVDHDAILSLDVVPEVVRTGDSAQVLWSVDGEYVDNVDECQVLGGGLIDSSDGSDSSQVNVNSTDGDGVIDTTPRYNSTRYRFSCTDTVSGELIIVENRLEVIPVFFEI